MTVGELIDHVDDISPNQYTEDQKIAWISGFDGKVFREVIMTHETPYGMIWPYDGTESREDELLIREPYALDVYSNYLLAKIAEANAEIPKYNLYSTLFNTEYSQFVSYFHRTHKPRQGEGWRF